MSLKIELITHQGQPDLTKILNVCDDRLNYLYGHDMSVKSIHNIGQKWIVGVLVIRELGWRPTGYDRITTRLSTFKVNIYQGFANTECAT